MFKISLKKILLVTLGLSLFLLFHGPSVLPQAQAFNAQCLNPFYAIAHQSECGGNDATNPYCKNPQDCGVNTGINATGSQVNGISTSTDVRALIFGWIQFFLGFLFLIAVVALIYAGVLLITSFGNDSKRQKGIKIITWTLIGIILIIFSYAIVNTVIQAGR